MKFLLDTHILIWYLEGNKKLPESAVDMIKDKNNQIYISIVSFWEIVLKLNIGKLKLPLSVREIYDLTLSIDIEVLNIDINHLININELPFHHRDPFDRLIISTAKYEDMHIITMDDSFKLYDIKMLEI